MTQFILIACLIWAVSVGAWWLATRVLRNKDAEKVRSRLLGTPPKKKDKAAAKGPSLIRVEEHGALAVRVLNRMQLNRRLEQLIEQAGLKMKVSSLVNSSLLLFAGAYAACWMFAPGDFRRFAILPALAASAFPILRILRMRSARLRKFEEAFPESLEFVARSMRAGHAFAVSLEMIHREFADPLGGEFRRTFEEHNLGMPLDLALEKLGKRVPLLDVQFFVSAVTLQKRTGGNLAEILDKLAYVIRERFKLRGKIRAISAHGRLTGTALTLIPVAVGVLMFLTNPEYIRFFFNDETGHIMLAVAVGFQLVGYAIIQKIVSIEV